MRALALAVDQILDLDHGALKRVLVESQRPPVLRIPVARCTRVGECHELRVVAPEPPIGIQHRGVSWQ